MHRVLVVGTTGSGKTTTAAALARLLNTQHIELDALWWKPNWTESEHDDFRERVAAVATGDRWVADGNYITPLGDTLWSRADSVVWLDVPLPVIVVRLIRRTISRSLRKTELWAGNREHISTLWKKKESLVFWALRVHRDHQARYGGRMADPAWSHIEFVHLRSKREIKRWLSRLDVAVSDASS